MPPFPIAQSMVSTLQRADVCEARTLNEKPSSELKRLRSGRRPPTETCGVWDARKSPRRVVGGGEFQLNVQPPSPQLAPGGR